MRKKHSAVVMTLSRQQWYHHTGINDILREAGIPKGSFYNFFESKENFGEEVIHHYGKQQYTWLKEILEDPSKTPFERIQKLYDDLKYYSREEQYLQGCMINNLSVEVAGLSEKIAKVADEEFRHWVEIIAQAIHEGQQTGEIRSDISAEHLAHFIHTNLYGAQSRMKATRSSEPLDMILFMTLDYFRPPVQQKVNA